MNKSEVQYWIKRYDIKYQQNKENYDKLKECEQQLQSYKQKEDKLREYIEKYNKVNAEKADTNADRLTMLINADDLLQILNEGDK